MKADKHPFEAARVAALRRYDILDTPRESDFDDIVELASAICQTPISVINLIDADRQWFKAETGLGVRETPLDTSICAHVILEQDFVEIPDTLADRRMADNPLCAGDTGLRFYAGAILRSADGYPIGTLCVLDNAPRALDAFQRRALTVLASQVTKQLELRAEIANGVVLRKEMDHRVKNSLATVAAFVALERRTADDPASDELLGRIAQQIETVALLHDKLGTSDDNNKVDLGDYLGRVTRMLAAVSPERIAITGVFAPFQARARQAATLAMVVNELVANSIKHAFGDDAGRITLTGELASPTLYRLTCQDDGRAPQTPSAPHKRQGLGLAIINASVRQLDGTMTTARDENGYTTVIECQLAPG